MVDSVRPLYGPMVGGTRVIISGHFISLPTIIAVYIGQHKLNPHNNRLRLSRKRPLNNNNNNNTGLPSWQRDWTGPIMLIVLFLVSHFNFLFVSCGRLPVSFLLHFKYTLSYRTIRTLHPRSRYLGVRPFSSFIQIFSSVDFHVPLTCIPIMFSVFFQHVFLKKNLIFNFIR